MTETVPTRLQLIEVEYLLAINSRSTYEPACAGCSEINTLVAKHALETGETGQWVTDERLSLYDSGRQHLTAQHRYQQRETGR